ncbi:MAG: Imidazole glycerol phosphate synthase subunit HisF, partial [Proteiniphilum sp. 51_7]
VSVPVIASGGAGSMDHFAEVFTVTNASAALAASIFHYGEIAIPALKQYLKERNIPIR